MHIRIGIMDTHIPIMHIHIPTDIMDTLIRIIMVGMGILVVTGIDRKHPWLILPSSRDRYLCSSLFTFLF